MRRRFYGMLAGSVAAIAMMAPGASARVKGQYMEVRSADVWTGPCFANGQADLVGKEAILAWKVTTGEYNGVPLNGLGIVAVVKARNTLGDTYHNPYPAESVLILDSRANRAQRAALEAMAKAQAGRLLAHVMRVDEAPIELTIAQGMSGVATLRAGKLAMIQTRSLCEGDGICGNEEIYYPPLVADAHATPAYTLKDAFSGKGLGVVWTRWDRRSAFVGSFSL